jgi:SAM-dependent methyltransferase
MATNADQIAYWNGPVGEHWRLEQEAIDRAFAAFTAKLHDVAALRRGQRVLDVGCGCGTTTLFAADTVGEEGSVVGVDVSVPMVARANERSAGRANVSYLLADASAFRFDGSFDRTFDVEISRFGVMFFDDPVQALANLRSALRPGGRIAFACWRPPADNAWVRVPREVALRHVPPAPPVGPEEPGPFSFGDSVRVRRILEGAKFSRVDIAPFDADVVLSEEGVEAAADFVMRTGPTAALLREVSDETKERVRTELEAALRPFTRSGRTALGGAVWVVSAVG